MISEKLKKKSAEEISAGAYRKPMIISKVFILRSRNENYGYYICPRCDTSMEREFTAFCNNCGQALDWSKYENAIPVYPKTNFKIIK